MLGEYKARVLVVWSCSQCYNSSMDGEFFEEEREDYELVQRSRVFVLIDGTFVVRWSENRVQELQSGHYRSYNRREDFGAPITDYELNQLKAAGLVDEFDRDWVRLSLITEQQVDFDDKTAWEKSRNRSYYLNTTLPGALLQDVADLLEDLGLADSFQPRVRDDFVVLWGSRGTSFHKFDDVEKARNLLATRSPEAFENTVVAFIETDRRS